MSHSMPPRERYDTDQTTETLTFEDALLYMDGRLRGCAVLGPMYLTRSAAKGTTASAITDAMRAMRTGSQSTVRECIDRIRQNLLPYEYCMRRVIDDVDMRRVGPYTYDNRLVQVVVADALIEAARRYVEFAMR